MEQMDGPIPGENYTSDTKNYPWHRPPQHTDLDSAIEDSFKKMTEENAAIGLLTMIKMGVDIATLTDMFVTAGIGAGKWTPDFAILLAGPISHIMYLMAKGYGIDCDLGIEDKRRPITKAFFDTKKKVDGGDAKEASQDINLDSIKSNAKAGGFMGAAGAPAPEEIGETDDSMAEEVGEY